MKVTTYNSAEPLISCIIFPEKTPQILPLLFFLLFSFPILKKGSVFYLKPFYLEPHKTLLKILLLSKIQLWLSLATGIIMINLVVFICDEQKSNFEGNPWRRTGYYFIKPAHNRSLKPALIILFLAKTVYTLRIILILARMTVFTKQFWAINLTIILKEWTFQSQTKLQMQTMFF